MGITWLTPLPPPVLVAFPICQNIPGKKCIRLESLLTKFLNLCFYTWRPWWCVISSVNQISYFIYLDLFCEKKSGLNLREKQYTTSSDKYLC